MQLWETRMDKDGQGWMAAELLVSVTLVLCLGVGVECGQKKSALRHTSHVLVTATKVPDLWAVLKLDVP